MWFYGLRILVPYEIADSASHQRPRGNLSDLYPRWLGARELWRHGRNPYSDAVTREIQAGYYGRVLDPKRPDDPGDQQGFAYPVYVTFLLLPTLGLPFPAVRLGFLVLLGLLTALSAVLWLRALRWRLTRPDVFAVTVLTLGSFAAFQGIRLQQLSLVVEALIAACAALLASGELFAAGVVLALATIKPQLVALLAAFLLLWAVSAWRSRCTFVAGFGLTLAALCLGAQWLLPGWVADFWHAIHRYQQYTGGRTRLDVLLGPMIGKAVALAAIVLLGFLCVRFRREAADKPAFCLAFAAILAVTLLVVPNFAPYNELLLLPAILLLVREAIAPDRPAALRPLVVAAGFFIGWGWLATAGLTVASLFLPATTVQRAWAIPLWSEFAIAPSVVLALALLIYQACKTNDARTLLHESTNV